MIKILLLSVNLQRGGGVANYTNLLIKNIDSEEFTIKHFTQGRSLKIWKNFFLPFIIIYQLIHFKQVLKIFKPDLVHINPSLRINSILRDIVFLLIAKLNNIPTICFVRGWDSSISNNFSNKMVSTFFRFFFMFPKIIIVLASEFKRELEYLGIASDKIRLETTMVEYDKYKVSNKTFKAPYNLLFCSRIESYKGIYELLFAFAIVLRKYPNTKLTYMGEGNELYNLKLKIEQLGLTDNVNCTGNKVGREKIEIYQFSHIFVFPTYAEGFPNVYCEAMASGLPVVTSLKGGLIDVFKDSKHGFSIQADPPKPREIATNIVKLLREPNLLNIISKNNSEEARKMYNSNVVSSRIGKHYTEVSGLKI